MSYHTNAAPQPRPTKPTAAMIAYEQHVARKAAGLPALEKTYVLFGEEVPASFARFCQDCTFYDAPGMTTGHCRHAKFDAAREAPRGRGELIDSYSTAHSTCDDWKAVEAVKVAA